MVVVVVVVVVGVGVGVVLVVFVVVLPISTSAPSMVCFVHFDFNMCFAPQLRALFQHPNYQNWFKHLVF